MSKLTLEEAISHCLEVAEQNDAQAEKWREEGGEEWGKTTACRECAAEHRQLAEWLTDYKELKKFNDKIYDVLAKQFGSPRNLDYAVDEYMRRNGSCDDCGVEISDKECWHRYIQTNLSGGSKNG